MFWPLVLLFEAAAALPVRVLLDQLLFLASFFMASTGRCSVAAQVLHAWRSNRDADLWPLGPPRQQPNLLGRQESGRDQGLRMMAPAMTLPSHCCSAADTRPANGCGKLPL